MSRQLAAEKPDLPGAPPDPGGKLGFGPLQYGLLVVLTALFGAIAVTSYSSSRQITQETEALNDLIWYESGTILSLQREVLTYAVTVERWSAANADRADVETDRALVARQRSIITRRNLPEDAYGADLAALDDGLSRVDEVVASGGSVFDDRARQELDEAIFDTMFAAKRLTNVAEARHSTQVAHLQRQLRSAQRAEGLAAVSTIAVGILLVISLQRMLRANYRLASEQLGREHARYTRARRAQARVENRFREVVDEVSDVVFRIDAEGRWTLLNEAWVRLSGVPIDDAIGHPVIESFSAADRRRVEQLIQDLVGGRRSQDVAEVVLIRPDGTDRSVVLSARATRDDGVDGVPRAYLSGTMNDVTERVRAQQVATAQTEVLELVARDTPVDMVLDRIADIANIYVPSLSLRFVTDGAIDDRATGSVALADTRGGEPLGILEWTVGAGAPEDDLEAMIWLASQLGALALDRRRAADRIVHQATHDALTGLPNRFQLNHQVHAAIQHAVNDGQGFTLMFLDVDRFKVVNDSLGHEAGDHLLTQIAERLEAVTRPDDTVARFGGDEFVVLVERISDNRRVVELAERILAVVSEPLEVDGNPMQVSASIGIVSGDGSSAVDELLKHADVAMYRAKQAGRATYAVFDQEMQQWASRRHDTEVALRDAVANEDLEVWYQPVVGLTSGTLTGFEALARWNRPGIGYVPPDEFIPVAEELGLISDIGTWMLRSAIDQLERWRHLVPELTVSVNVSGRELVRADYVEMVSSQFADGRDSQPGLILEITESVLLEDTARIQAHLHALKGLGVRIAIDDFGTGYSSLQYLRTLSVDILKIDRAFVSDMGSDDLVDPAIVTSVTDLGHALGLEVLAEGIETAQQASALVAAGVDSGQGYFYGRPTEVDVATSLVVDRVALAEREMSGPNSS